MVKNGNSGRFLRQKVLPPAKCPRRRGEGVLRKAVARAKTDRIDAELIARFFAFRPEAGRSLPAEKLQPSQSDDEERSWPEMRKRLLAQIRAHQKLGTAVMFESPTPS